MAKLRHIAMVVEDMEATAAFYEHSFGMKRVRQTATAIGLSDGVVSLVIIHPSNVNMKGDSRRGLHHVGFLIDDMEQVAATVEANGGVYSGEILGSGRGPMTERKYRDPNGQPFDITTVQHAKETWHIDVGA
ncbi:MAG TPA: VOC family protein [Candidatus Limnocylindria bacterium]|nr:VOC family protein [Candidatus Limnocylindria bacterium]